MAQTLEVPGISDELVRELDDRLRTIGQDRTTYFTGLIERDLHTPALSQVPASIRQQIAAIGTDTTDVQRITKSRPPASLPSNWTDMNDRRFFLISKEETQGLSSEEQAELRNLLTVMRQCADAAFPLPFAELEKLEEFARNLIQDKADK